MLQLCHNDYHLTNSANLLDACYQLQFGRFKALPLIFIWQCYQMSYVHLYECTCVSSWEVPHWHFGIIGVYPWVEFGNGFVWSELNCKNPWFNDKNGLVWFGFQNLQMDQFRFDSTWGFKGLVGLVWAFVGLMICSLNGRLRRLWNILLNIN